MTASLALKRRGELPHRLIGVEAEPQHFQWMLNHFRDNGIDPDAHTLIHAAVANKDTKEVLFRVDKPDEWGESIITDQNPRGNLAHCQKIRAVSLFEVIHDCATIDLVDMDVQGAELVVLAVC